MGNQQLDDLVTYEGAINQAYHDSNGVLTFNLPLPYEIDLKGYIYGIGIVTNKDNQKILLSTSKMPKMFKTKGLGGTLVYKIAVKRSSADIIYNKTDVVFATDEQALEGKERLKANTLQGTSAR